MRMKFQYFFGLRVYFYNHKWMLRGFLIIVGHMYSTYSAEITYGRQSRHFGTSVERLDEVVKISRIS